MAVDITLADRIAAVVATVPGVAELHGGALDEVATYLPGRRVKGVRLADDGRCAVHVVLDWGAPVRPTADAVRAEVAPLVDGPVDVTVEDVLRAAAPTPESEALT